MIKSNKISIKNLLTPNITMSNITSVRDEERKMLNFCITTEGSRIRGHNKTIFIQIWDAVKGRYEDELSFSNMGQAGLSYLRCRNAD